MVTANDDSSIQSRLTFFLCHTPSIRNLIFNEPCLNMIITQSAELTHLTVLNLASLTLQSNASPTAPIVASGTHAAVSTHHAFPTSAMMARSSAVARRNVFHYYSCFILSYYFRCEPVRNYWFLLEMFLQL